MQLFQSLDPEELVVFSHHVAPLTLFPLLPAKLYADADPGEISISASTRSSMEIASILKKNEKMMNNTRSGMKNIVGERERPNWLEAEQENTRC